MELGEPIYEQHAVGCPHCWGKSPGVGRERQQRPVVWRSIAVRSHSDGRALPCCGSANTVLIVVLATDLWVYADATANRERGTPFVFSFGGVKLDRPTAWFLGWLLLWIVFFPAYITTRRHAL